MGNFIMPETGLIVVGKATNLLTDGGLNIWDDENTLTHWTESVNPDSSINREATEAHKIEGAYSCRMDVSADGDTVAINHVSIILIPNKKYKIIIWYKNSIMGKSFTARLSSFDSGVWLKSDGTWQATITTNIFLLKDSMVWKKVELEFYTHADYSNYTLQIKRADANSSSIYIDKASIVECDEFVPKAIGTMNFDSGSVEPQVGETLRGATSGSLAKVVSVTKSGGTWGNGDAVGSISLIECEGRFHDNENIDGMVGGANILTVNHPDTGVGVDKVRNGEFSVDDDPPSGWIAMNSALLTTEASGKIGNCLMITEDGGSSPQVYQNISVVPGEIYEFKGFIKAGTEATYQARLYDLTNGTYIWGLFNREETAGDWSTEETHTFVVPPGCKQIRVILLQACAISAGTTIYFDEVSLYEITSEEVVSDGKTLMVDSVVFVPTDADGDRLLLTDYDGNEFVNMKGLANRPNPIFFRKPRKLNGLKVAIIDSGKAYIYRSQK